MNEIKIDGPMRSVGASQLQHDRKFATSERLNWEENKIT